MMKKILISALLLCAMLVPANVLATSEAPSNVTEYTVKPQWVYTYTKTVVNYYTSFDSIPESIYYEEFLDIYGWCRGTLYLQSVVKSGSGYNATYSGTMRSNPL